MGIYFNMVNGKGEEIICNWKKMIGNIESKILKEKGELIELKLDKEYYLDIQDISRIINYYEELIKGYTDDMCLGDVGIIRNKYLPNLKKQLDKKEQKYIIVWN